MEKKIPKFVRQNYKVKGRVGDSWRKPRGIDNKQRIQKAGTSALPRIGYGSPRASRGMHSSGKYEVLVHTPAQLSSIKEKQAGRIAGGVGAKKRSMIAKKAKELGVKLLG